MAVREGGYWERTLVDILLYELFSPVIALAIQPETLDARKVVPHARVEDSADSFGIVS